LNFGENQAFQAMKAIQELRSKDIKTELYPDDVKIDKQFKYAERRTIPFVVKEIQGTAFVLKNLITGEQLSVTLEEMIEKIS
jgi:histidyl-tRNA synthetase